MNRTSLESVLGKYVNINDVLTEVLTIKGDLENSQLIALAVCLKDAYQRIGVLETLVDSLIRENEEKKRPKPLIRLKEVEEYIGLKRSTIYDMIQKNQFPDQVRLGRRSVGWRFEDVQNWINSRRIVSKGPDKDLAL